MNSATLLSLLPFVLAGCGTYTTAEVADPPNISVASAMAQVGDGLSTLNHKLAGQDKYGLLVDEVSVQFNVSAKATSDGKLGVTTANIPLSGGTISPSASADLTNESNRGNIITIKLKNIATADLTKGERGLIERCLRIPTPSGCDNVIKQVTPAIR